MPAKRKKRQIRGEGRRILNEALNAHWAIHAPALESTLAALDHVVEAGELPDAEILSYETRAGYTPRAVVEGGTAIIPIVGMIRPRVDFYTKYLGATACTEIAENLRAALADDDVSSIVFYVDSPGGSVTLVEETAQQIYAARGVKPMVTHVAGMMASAAYYLGSAADKIVATPSSMTGSIGTVIMHASYAEAYAKAGIEVTPVHYGKHKVDAHPYKKLDAQGLESLQSVVDAFGQQFVSAVARQRGVSGATVKSEFGDGKLYIAAEAAERGLVDEVGAFGVAATTQPQRTAAQAATPETLSAATVAPEITTQVKGGARNPVEIQTEKKPVNKIKALLFGLSLIDAIDASDETATAAVKAFCMARGQDLPTNADGGLDESKVVAILKGNSAPVAANVETAHRREMQEAREMTAAEHRQRRDDIEAVAALVNQTRTVVDAATIRAAVDSDQELAAIQRDWTEKLNAGPTGSPLALPISAGESAEDKFATTAVNVMLEQCGLLPAAEKPKCGFGDLGSMSLADIAAECLQISTGQRRRVTGANRELIASEALQGGPHGRREFGGVSASGGPAYNRPGDFPNLMSNLANKVLDNTIMLADVTFDQYANRMTDADDFKPSTIIASGTFDTIDDVTDGEEYKPLAMSEELKGWIAVARKGNAVKLTPVMVRDNDLDSFVNQLQTLGFAHDNALNYLVLSTLMSNPTLPDSTAMFDASRGNLIASGGAPSAAQAKLQRQAHRRIKGVGTNKTIRSVPRIALVPTEHEDAARQTYASFGEIPEQKRANTDANLNVHRGSVQIVVEPDMETFTNGTKIWYTIDNRIRNLVYRYMAGYGRGGRRTTWYNPANDCRSYGIEGRFSAAAVGFRGIVKNPGE